jgi:hypothetical protein
LPELPLPHPAPLELVAVACRWPGTVPFVIDPVAYEQTVFPGRVISSVVWLKAAGEANINAKDSRRRIVVFSSNVGSKIGNPNWQMNNPLKEFH